jgi:hypothetical protein
MFQNTGPIPLSCLCYLFDNSQMLFDNFTVIIDDFCFTLMPFVRHTCKFLSFLGFLIGIQISVLFTIDVLAKSYIKEMYNVKS